MRSLLIFLMMTAGALGGVILLVLAVDLFVKEKTGLALLALTALMAGGSLALNVTLETRDAGRRRR